MRQFTIVEITAVAVDQSTQQNAALVEQTTGASHSLTDEANDLGRLVGKFKLEGTRAAPGVARADATPNNPPVRSLGDRIASALAR
jgi:methyl-accepting chemotaxis protein